MNRTDRKWQRTIALIVILIAGQALAGGALDPTNAPGTTMYSLDEIYNKIDEISADSITIPDISVYDNSTGVDVIIVSNGSVITGNCTVVGREGAIMAWGIEHNVQISVDPQTGDLATDEQQTQLSFIKYKDRSTPPLYAALFDRQTLDQVFIRFYQTNQAGVEQNYFTITLNDANLVGMETLSASLERVTIAYKMIRWKDEITGEQATGTFGSGTI